MGKSGMKPVLLDGFKVESYLMRTYSGHRIGYKSKVTAPDGTVIRFTEKLPVKDAVKQAKYQLSKELKKKGVM